MSIIQEALKKAQTINQENKVVEPLADIKTASISSDNGLRVSSQIRSVTRIAEKVLAAPTSKKAWIAVWVFLVICIFAIQFMHKKDSPISRLNAMPASEAASVSTSRDVAAAVPASLPRLKLTGITFGEGESVAIINNNIVRENDMLEGSIVLEILPNDVRMSYNGYEFMLKLE